MRIGLDCLLAARDVAPPPPHTVRRWMGGGGAGIPVPGLLPPQSVSPGLRRGSETNLTYAMCYSHLPTKENIGGFGIHIHTEVNVLLCALAWGGVGVGE